MEQEKGPSRVMKHVRGKPLREKFLGEVNKDIVEEFDSGNLCSEKEINSFIHNISTEMADNDKFKTDENVAVDLLKNRTTVQFDRSDAKEDTNHVTEGLFEGDSNDTVLWNNILQDVPQVSNDRCISRVCGNSDDSVDTLLWDIALGCSSSGNSSTNKETGDLSQREFNDVRNSREERQYKWVEKLVFQGVHHPCHKSLPEGWIQAVHSTGMPVFLHKETRVCTFTRPYFLGHNSLRNHELPMSNIPCLQYRTIFENVASEKVKTELTDSYEKQFTVKTEVNSDGEAQAKTRTEAISNDETEITVKTEVLSDDEEQLKTGTAAMSNNELQIDVRSEVPSGDEVRGTVNPEVKNIPGSNKDEMFGKISAVFFTNDEVQDYCKRLFPHEVVKYKAKPVRELRERRSQNQNRVSDNVRVITCPITHSSVKRLFVATQGKNYCTILHEYTTKFMSASPTYDFVSANQPDGQCKATLFLKGKQYGTGFGTNKKAAKIEAAKATLKILVPQFKNYIPTEEEPNHTMPLVETYSKNFCFNDLEITDERVPDLLATVGEFSPYEILKNSLNINFGTPVHIQTEIKHVEGGIELTMRALKQSVSITCSSIIGGKQKAAQVMLQHLHPDLKNWDSLLQLYGKNAMEKRKEEKLLDPDINQQEVLSGKSFDGEPIIKKLKQEMQKLYEGRHNKSNEKFAPPQGLSDFTGSQMDCDE